jgi:GABA permease
MSKKVLVIANETCAGRELLDTLKQHAAGAEVLVVAPALNSRLRHILADVDKAREAAEERLTASIAELRGIGIEARGAVGDSDPVRAAEDALAEFHADEIVVSTHPEKRSNWLEKGVVERITQKFQLPVTHVVVDLDREAAAAR